MESNFESLHQKEGPALGVFEIEPVTYDAIQKYLNRYDNSRFKEYCLCACFYLSWPPKEALIQNLAWATIIAAVKYHMIEEKIPSSFDPEAMAQYYKKYYNTSQGKAEVNVAVESFKKAISIVNSQI